MVHNGRGATFQLGQHRAFPDSTQARDPGTPCRYRSRRPATGPDSSPSRSVAVVCDHPHALPRPIYARGGAPGDPAVAVGPPSPRRRVEPPLRNPSARRGASARPVRSTRRRPANPSPTAAATDEGRRGCRRGGGRATAAASRTGQVPQTVADKHANAAIPPPPHRERVAVASPRRRPAGVTHRPRQRRADHRHVGREGGAEGARSRQRRGRRRRRVTGWGGRGTSPPHPRGMDGEAPPARDRRGHRWGRRRPLGWRRSGWCGTRRRRGGAPP